MPTVDAEMSMWYRDHINRLVDELVKFLREEAGIEPKPEEIYECKYIVNQLVPYKSALSSMMISLILGTLLVEAASTLDGAKDFLESSATTEEVLAKLDESQKKRSKQYKNTKIDGRIMKIADLGDVMSSSTSSLN